MSKKQLFSNRLLLRPVSKGDISSLFQLQSHPEVARHSALGVPEKIETSEALVLEAIQNSETFFQTQFWWIIQHKKEGTFLGETGMNRSFSNPKNAELFYSLLPAYWGNGFAEEAVTTILNFAFSELGLQRITADVRIENKASIRLLEKLGMIREGRHRKILPARGEWCDNYRYGLWRGQG